MLQCNDIVQGDEQIFQDPKYDVNITPFIRPPCSLEYGLGGKCYENNYDASDPSSKCSLWIDQTIYRLIGHAEAFIHLIAMNLFSSTWDSMSCSQSLQFQMTSRAQMAIPVDKLDGNDLPPMQELIRARILFP